MAETLKPPAEVLALAAQVKLTPIAWAVADDHITIVFEQGPKMRFDREPAAVISSPQEKPAKKTPPAAVIDLHDGASAAEASLAGKTLATRKSQKE